VFELAPRAIGAVELLMKTLAKLGLVVLGHMRLRVELVSPMSEGATVFEGASPR
jgi:hypothetical protein